MALRNSNQRTRDPINIPLLPDLINDNREEERSDAVFRRFSGIQKIDPVESLRNSDLNLFSTESKVNLFNDSKLARRANRLCLKQLKKDQTNPQCIFQVAYTYLALREFDEAKKYLDLAIEKEYPAALFYSWVAWDNEWINYEEEPYDNLVKAVQTEEYEFYLRAHSFSD